MNSKASILQRKRVAILISGRGSNMAALIEAAEMPSYPATISLVISNKADAGGLELARNAGVQTAFISQKSFPTREAFDQAVHDVLIARKIEIVALAGFMRILSPWFCEQWRGRMINIHPSLLPAYKGVDTHARVLAAHEKEHGCTAHFITPELDDGPTILQARVPVLPHDDESSLAARVLAQEHVIYPRALAMLADGRVILA
jgi:phosphoribosylglycinamide formyltransferase 1